MINIEPKFKIGQTLYLVYDEWYQTSYRTFIARGIQADYDYKYFMYQECSNGSSYHKEEKCFGSLADVKEFLITRLTNGVTERIKVIAAYQEEVTDETE